MMVVELAMPVVQEVLVLVLVTVTVTVLVTVGVHSYQHLNGRGGESVGGCLLGHDVVYATARSACAKVS